MIFNFCFWCCLLICTSFQKWSDYIKNFRILNSVWLCWWSLSIMEPPLIFCNINLIPINIHLTFMLWLDTHIKRNIKNKNWKPSTTSYHIGFIKPRLFLRINSLITPFLETNQWSCWECSFLSYDGRLTQNSPSMSKDQNRQRFDQEEYWGVQIHYGILIDKFDVWPCQGKSSH